MNRSNFLKLALGLAAFPFAATKALSKTHNPYQLASIKWTVEQDTLAFYGDEAYAHMVKEIQMEIDKEMVRILMKNAR